jgi:hypothetical protein
MTHCLLDSAAGGTGPVVTSAQRGRDVLVQVSTTSNTAFQLYSCVSISTRAYYNIHHQQP